MFGSTKTRPFIIVIGDANEIKSLIEIVQSFGGTNNLRITSFELLNPQTVLFRYSNREAEPRLEGIRELSKKFETLQFLPIQATEILKFMKGHVHDLTKDSSG